MGRFERIAKQVLALPMDRQDMIANEIELVFDENFNPRSLLSERQLEIVRQRMAKPFEADIATDDEVRLAFAELLSKKHPAG
jgi:hypothetical protein